MFLINIRKLDLTKISLQKLKPYFIWLIKQDGSPANRARGMAIGVFSGCFPFFGFQTLIGILLATMFKGNKILAAAATWISNPFTYVPLYWFNFKIGSFLLNQENPYPKDLDSVPFEHLWDQGLYFSNRLLLGSMLVGLFLGSLTGSIFYLILKSSKLSNK